MRAPGICSETAAATPTLHFETVHRRIVHIHLDPVGGIAGDMFIAGLLDAFPNLADGLLQTIQSAQIESGVSCRILAHSDNVLCGKRFLVDEPHPDRHSHEHPHDHIHHDHATFQRIRDHLRRSALIEGVKQHSIGIFTALASAESRVHGIAPEAVSFHEVGMADSIADIVGAAYIIDTLKATRWSVGSVPLGSGRVRSAHGVLPVPSPATAALLEGFLTHDDGRVGERVTPTGAAIVRYLECASEPYVLPRRLLRSGIGFGTSTFPGISNCLRVLVFDEASTIASVQEVAVLQFEIDDQSGEDLAIGLERLRALPEVLDAVQMPAFGKKGRMMVHVQVLTKPAQLHDVIQACFAETTTIGLRYQIVRRAELERREARIELEGHSVPVKVVHRAGADRTAKSAADAVASAGGGHAERDRLRRAAEDEALRKEK